MAYYFLIFLPVVEGGYAILSPDYPELTSQADTLEECMTMGADALAIMAEEYAKARRPLPEPSSMAQARTFAVSEIDDSVDLSREPILQLIQAPNVDMTPVKISISLPKSDLEAIDAKARRLGMTRSGLLASAAKVYPGGKGRGASC
ncbi:Predicted nuclease of the RNAse H fold, HicB family [Desulfomicrobium apsheronum]|uniref:Predicted nuclease of the RNAse H fold, HicB family n=1 Tax=Desulfomicrobium apsheronum TaxID=52560 RepID=A0A1I3YI05_9BACT|nr:type II toxin-antitoxin system HicB family antitoxin [Desulfomicrobium apsheronum]SFK31455.1 Predicted nuclease of the RNAse H fold, HicB family [Desulfomicrobium apsheronum]